MNLSIEQMQDHIYEKCSYFGHRLNFGADIKRHWVDGESHDYIPVYLCSNQR